MKEMNLHSDASSLGQDFWEQRYQSQQTAWDLGQVAPAIQKFIDSLTDKDLRILIPGCGRAHEAAYLQQQGFRNITLIDIAPSLVSELQTKFAGQEQVKVILGDFFAHEGVYDLILEQTFFCALNPSLRPAYVSKMHALLAKDGLLAGLLFDRFFEKEGPPFGGSRAEYAQLFQAQFKIETMEAAEYSIAPRAQTELWVALRKQ